MYSTRILARKWNGITHKLVNTLKILGVIVVLLDNPLKNSLRDVKSRQGLVYY